MGIPRLKVDVSSNGHICIIHDSIQTKKYYLQKVHQQVPILTEVVKSSSEK